jgi:hypothetical protein
MQQALSESAGLERSKEMDLVCNSTDSAARTSDSGVFAALLIFISLITSINAACRQGSETPQSLRQSTGAGAVCREVPKIVQVNAKYLFYLHGRIIEEQGVNAVSPTFGPYEYERILHTFADTGFIVISEPRGEGTEVRQYASKVAGQINSLIHAGVAPGNITVVGASKGGSIAAATSSQLQNREVNYVLLAACATSELYGNVLSIWDYKDDTGAATCKRDLAQAKGLNNHKEVELRLGLGHGVLYRPLKEWIDPVVDWANNGM